MMEVLITCPRCGNEFEISDAFAGKLREHLRAEMLEEIVRREGEVKKKIKATEEREREIEKARDELDQQIQAGIKARLKESEEKAAKRMEDKYAEQFKELQDELKERSEKISRFKEQELDLRKKQRDLERAKDELELTLARKLDEERARIREQAAKKADEAHRIKDMEKEKIISDLRRALEDMKRKAEQGSVQTQGEALEQDFEAQLKSFFPNDDIRPVPKGFRGADIVHIVRTPIGQECGTVLWEIKNTKAWSASWIQKLKDDMVATRAGLAVIVSVVLPDDIARFGQVDGVWVSDPFCALPLGAALRQQLFAVSREKTISVGKNEKMESLYQYLSGTEFKQKIEGIVEAFIAMQEQLNQERRAMEKHWNQREKQIQRVIRNTAGLYGDLQGIIGGQIPAIPALELDDDGRDQPLRRLSKRVSKRDEGSLLEEERQR